MAGGATVPSDVLAGRIVIGIDGVAKNLAIAGKAVDGFVGGIAAKLSRMTPLWQGFSARIQQVGAQLQSMANAANRSLQPLSTGLNNVTKSVTGLGVAAGLASVNLIKLASDANEASSKFGYVFQQASDKTGKSLDEFAAKAGRSRYAMRNMAADIGALLQPMGFTREKTGELSVAVSKLAVDLSSFFNVSESDALIALKAGIVGESEPLRRLGVNLNEAKIQQEAFKLGIAKSKDEVQGAIKAQAILSLTLRESAQAQGDAIRTSDQFANSWRRLTSYWEDAKTDLGMSLIPLVTKYAQAGAAAAKQLSEWAQANQEMLQQRVDSFFERVAIFGEKIVISFKSVWAASQKVRDALGEVVQKVKDFYDKGRAAFDRLPKWQKDLLLVGGTLTGLSVGLKTIGGSIPFVGQFATAFGDLINPVGILSGLFKTLWPLVTVLGETLGTVVGLLLTPEAVIAGGIVAGIAGFVLAIKKAIEVSDEAKQSWENIKDTLALIKAQVTSFIDGALKILSEWWEKNGEQIDRIQTKLGELAVKVGGLAVIVGEKLANAFEVIAGTSLPMLLESLGGLEGTFNNLLDLFETYVDFFSGDGRRSTVLYNEVIIGLNESLITLLETLAQVPERFGGFLGSKVAGSMRDKAESLKTENNMRRLANDVLSDQIAEDDRKRASERALKSGVGAAGVGSGIGAAMGLGNAPLDADAIRKATDIQEQERLKFKKSNASQVAQTDNAVAKQQAADAGPYGIDVTGGLENAPLMGTSTGKKISDAKQRELAQQKADEIAKASIGAFMATDAATLSKLPKGLENTPLNPLGISASQANANLSANIRQNRASANQTISGLRGQLSGMSGSERAAGAQDIMAIMQRFAMAAQLQEQAMMAEGQDRQDLLLKSEKLRMAADAQATAFQNGARGAKALGDAAENVVKDFKDLDKAEKDRIAQQKGQPTAAQMQAMQTQQQFAQQVAQQFQQAGQQAFQQQAQGMFEGAQQALQQALGGPEQVQALIDQASAKGDMKGAIALIRQRLEEQLKVSKSNLHNLASDVIGGGGFGAEHGGVSNDAYFMTLDIPVVRLIKFLQAQLDNLPKLAAGGIITKPTQAILGEAGPEAVIPLSAINTGPLTMLQNVLGSMFGGMRGGGLTAGMLGAFGSAFRNAQYWLSAGMDTGMPGAAGALKSWMSAQQNASSFLDNLYRYRQINLAPGGGYSYGGVGVGMGGAFATHGGGHFGFGNVVINTAFHGVNVNDESQLRYIGNRLYDHIANAARARGRDMSGRDLIRSPQNFGAPIVNSPTALRR